jgi:hypothetical protein
LRIIAPCLGTRHGAHKLPASTSVVRIYSSSCCRSDGAQIVRRGLAAPSVSNNIKRDLLSLVEPRHSGSFDRADVDEDVLAAVIRLDEAEAFLAIEPLHGSLRHLAFLSVTCVIRPRLSAAVSFEIWRKVVSPTRACAARPSRSAEARSTPYGALRFRSQGVAWYFTRRIICRIRSWLRGRLRQLILGITRRIVRRLGRWIARGRLRMMGTARRLTIYPTSVRVLSCCEARNRHCWTLPQTRLRPRTSRVSRHPKPFTFERNGRQLTPNERT